MNRQLFEHHPAFGYRFIPSLKARVEHEAGGYLVRSNKSGFRCEHDFTPNSFINKKRILLFGDSFTAGDGVSNKKRFGEQLESQFEDLEIWNYGISGTGTDQQYLIYREFASEVNADLVIIAILVENIRRNTVQYRPFFNSSGEEQWIPKPYFKLNSEKLVLHNVPVPKEAIGKNDISQESAVDPGGKYPYIRGLVNKLGPNVKRIIQKISSFDPVPEYKSSNNPEWNLMSAIIEQWVSKIKQPVLLMPIPLYHHLEETASPTNYQKRFKELASRTNVMLHDPLEDLKSYSKQDRRNFRFKKDIHPTPLYHKALANSLAPIIRSVFTST